MRQPEPTLDELAAFQAALLDLLDQDLSLEQMLGRLRAGPAFRPLLDYAGEFEPRMVEVAALLVKKWGRRGDRGDDCIRPPAGIHSS